MIITPLHKQILAGKICPYCKQGTVYVDSVEVYGKSYGMIYLCRPCRSWVGVHKGTDQALGRLANDELRKAKIEAHEYFNKIFELKFLKRKEAYAWLSNILGIPREYTHIGMFSVKTCRDVTYFSKQLLNDIRRLDMDFGDEPKTPYYDL